MVKKMKLFVATAVSFGFLLTPYLALADGYPAGDNSAAIVGVPGKWAPKPKGQSAGKAGKAKFPPGDNSVANVGVPKAWAPTTKTSTYQTGVPTSKKFPPGDNSVANVGVPAAWAPK